LVLERICLPNPVVELWDQDIFQALGSWDGHCGHFLVAWKVTARGPGLHHLPNTHPVPWYSSGGEPSPRRGGSPSALWWDLWWLPIIILLTAQDLGAVS